MISGRLKGGILLTLLLVGCASLESGLARKLPHTPEMDKSFQQAERVFFARRFHEAKLSYQSYLSRFPYNSLTAKAQFRLGEISFHENDFSRAVSFYRKSLAKGIEPPWGPVAVYKMAVAYSRLGEPKKVLSALDRLLSEDASIGVRAGSLRVSTAKKLSDPLEEKKGYLGLIDAYEALPPSDSKIGELNWIVDEKTARDEVRGWIAAEGGDESREIGRLKGWVKRFEGKSSGGYLTWKIAWLYHQKGDYKNAEEWTRKYLEGYPKHEYAAAANSLLSELGKRVEVAAAPAKGEGQRAVVGVLLPLSGKFSVYGESVLHGIECAAGIFAPCQGDLGVNLLVRDTRGDPQMASKILEEFSKNSEVRAVIGPLPQVEVDEAVVVAEKAGLPMVTLSQKPDVAKEGAFIFRNFLTVADQVATLVDYACGDKRWKKFALLFPRGEGGEEYRKEFEKEVDHCGGKVVAAASYPPGAKNFTEAVRSLKLSGPFQALFFPDVYRRVPELLGTLKFLEIEGVHLLGGAGWDHPRLVSLAGESAGELEGSVFVDGFFAKGSSYPVRDFVSTFQSSYAVEPTLLEAYAYDTMRLLGGVLREHPDAGRTELQKILAQTRNFAGVTGNISFDEDGDARRRLSVLMVEEGEIKEVK